MEAAVVVDGDDDDDDEVGFFFSSTVESMVFADRFVPLCCGEGSMSLSLSSSSLSSAINPRMPGCGNGLDAVAVGSVAFPPLPGAVEDPALTSSSESESLPYSPRASIVDRWMDGWMDGWMDRSCWIGSGSDFCTTTTLRGHESDKEIGSVGFGSWADLHWQRPSLSELGVFPILIVFAILCSHKRAVVL